MHDDFECPSPRDYVDTKSCLAYEQNPYSTHWVRLGSCYRGTSLGYNILSTITWLWANTNIINNWHANLTSSHYDNTLMLHARGLHNLNTASTTLSCSAIASMTWYLHRTTANSPQLCRHQHDSIASSPAWLSIYIVSPPSCPGSDVACMTQQHHHQHDSTYTSLLVFLSHRIIYKRTDANCSLHPRVFQCIESIGKQ
jgi:hypothetical protein